jgi:hypothetical protein
LTKSHTIVMTIILVGFSSIILILILIIVVIMIILITHQADGLVLELAGVREAVDLRQRAPRVLRQALVRTRHLDT